MKGSDPCMSVKALFSSNMRQFQICPTRKEEAVEKAAATWKKTPN